MEPLSFIFDADGARRHWPTLWPYIGKNGYSIIYLIKKIVNEKIYIGITKKPPAQRKAAHFSDAKAGRKTKICRAIRKYGRHSFEFYIVGMYKDHDLTKQAETRWIAALQPEYNTTAGGEGGPSCMLGRTHTPESKEKMRVAKLGKPGPWAGKKRSSESVEKMRATLLASPTKYWLGKKRDPETVRKILATKAAKRAAAQ